MSPSRAAPTRVIGLDIHKHYLVAVGVDAQQQVVFGPQHVAYTQLTSWIAQHVTLSDAVVLEMTTNAFQIHDEVLPCVQSVLVVHPQHVALVTQVPVKTDTKAALALTQLHAAGMLKGVWVPPPAVRDLRTLVIQRQKLRRLATQARNRTQRVPALKTELVYQQQDTTRNAARSAIVEYVEVFYNRQRRHAALGYCRPVEYEAQQHAQQMVGQAA